MLVGLRVSAKQLHAINVVEAKRLDKPKSYRKNPIRCAPTNVVGNYSVPQLAKIEYHIFGEELL